MKRVKVLFATVLLALAVFSTGLSKSADGCVTVVIRHVAEDGCIYDRYDVCCGGRCFSYEELVCCPGGCGENR
jgi:hypothetical protein